MSKVKIDDAPGMSVGKRSVASDFTKMSYYEVRLKAKKLVRYLQIHDPRFSTQNQVAAAEMIDFLQRKQEISDIAHDAGHLYIEAERLRRKGGFANRWRSWMKRREADRYVRNVTIRRDD